ncbi:MAG: sigma-54-dependent transcriptional regulator [Elusimicrobiota bacterium]
MPQATILLVDDEIGLAGLWALELKSAGYAAETVSTEKDAVKRVENSLYDLVITDLKLGRMSGLDLLRKIKSVQPETEVLIVTGYGAIDTAVAAIKAGAFDYLTKPVESAELILAVQKAIEHKELLSEVARLRSQSRDKYSFEGIVYSGSKMRKVLDLVRKVAATEATVLIEGESGTGKELIARAIHDNSPRRNGAFVAINCGALPEGLLESELFGHVRGSFTGADRTKRGLFEEADDGTIFLDEIAETTPTLQVKLLRALQEGEIRRVGDNHPIKVSPRIVAASNKSLADLVAANRFRDDLFYRLKVFPIFLPPLRERPEDIIPLAEHFMRKARKKLGSLAARISPSAAKSLLGYPWPGNARELEHAVERSLIMASGPVIENSDLPPEIAERAATGKQDAKMYNVKKRRKGGET